MPPPPSSLVAPDEALVRSERRSPVPAALEAVLRRRHRLDVRQTELVLVACRACGGAGRGRGVSEYARPGQYVPQYLEMLKNKPCSSAPVVTLSSII